jgi:hypothetical protein
VDYLGPGQGFLDRVFLVSSRSPRTGSASEFSRPTAVSPSGAKPASRSYAARRAEALDSSRERVRCIRCPFVGSTGRRLKEEG